MDHESCEDFTAYYNGLYEKARREAVEIPMETIRNRGAFNIQNDDEELIRRRVFRANFITRSIDSGLTYEEIGEAINRSPTLVRRIHEKILRNRQKR